MSAPLDIFRCSSVAGAAAWLALLLLGSGCGRKTEATKEDAFRGEATPATQAEIPSADADLLQNVAVGAAATNVALMQGDAAWKELVMAMRPPASPPEWETNPPSKEALEAFQKQSGLQAERVAQRAREFYTKFPQHEMAAEAREREPYFLDVAVQYGNTNGLTRLAALEEARLKDPKVSEEDRVQIRVNQLQRSLVGGSGTNLAERLKALEKGARAILKDFPAHHELGGLILAAASQWIELGDLDQARKLATELVEGSQSPDVKEEAEGLVRKIGRVGKPLQIKFKSVDGRDVDLAALKGKVVLVDFWATWCVPCMAELPKVKSAHEKLNPKGFEIIGVSLDREKDELLRVVSEKKIPWPQNFEEGGDSNKLAEEFEIAAIPTMWLVDKKGNLRELNAGENLVEKVERLLAE